MRPADGPIPETPLQRRLMRAIRDHVREARLGPGDTLSQLGLAERFGVSRSPVRAALSRLEALGVVEIADGTVRLTDPARFPELGPVEGGDPVEGLMAAIARSRHEGRLGRDVSESDLMRRLSRPRGEVVEALRRMAALGLVRRKPGFGWRFEEEPDRAARRESYRFRMIVEPAALREPGYAADRAWLVEARARHRRFAEAAPGPDQAIAFFELNAAFHRQLVAFSGNRFLIAAIDQQNSLRRLRNYSWRLDDDRVAESCADHIGVLDALIEGDTEGAARALHAHIESTMRSIA